MNERKKSRSHPSWLSATTWESKFHWITAKIKQSLIHSCSRWKANQNNWQIVCGEIFLDIELFCFQTNENILQKKTWFVTIAMTFHLTLINFPKLTQCEMNWNSFLSESTRISDQTSLKICLGFSAKVLSPFEFPWQHRVLVEIYRHEITRTKTQKVHRKRPGNMCVTDRLMKPLQSSHLI